MQLTAQDIQKLRDSGRLLQHETAMKEGDQIIAVNPTTGTKRVINTAGLMLEGAKSLLLD